MKPYFDQGGITIYHGDCREILPQLPEKSVQLLLTDPPYGVAYESGWRKDAYGPIIGDDGSLDIVTAILSALKCLQDQRHAYVFGPLDVSKLPVKAAELIWDKGIMGPGDLSSPWGPAHEVINFLAYYPSKAHRDMGKGNLAARLRRGSVIRVQRPDSERHPTEKPIELLRQLIESSSILGEMVLDPFMGSGSTLVAARLEGRKAIGIEIEERYCKVAAGRLAQGLLFTA